MFVTVLVWLYTLFLCYVYGFLFLQFSRRFMQFQADLPALPLILVSGLVVLTTLASFFSLFFQTGLLINLVLVAGAAGALLARKVSWPGFKRPKALLAFILLVLAALIVLENATHRPLNPDTNIYHAQAIHWIESFPALPGLGNLHGRLAFNSAWFVSNALFSFSFLGLRSFHLTAGVLFLAVVLYLWEGFEALAHDDQYKASTLLKVLFLPLAFSQFGAEISSPGTDLPVSLLLWLVAVLWAEYSLAVAKSSSQEQAQPFHPMLIVLFAAFALTVKLSAAPVLLLALFVFGETIRQRQKRQVGGLIACAALVLFPFLARNVILSGYLLYPFPALDLFSVDWKIPLQRAADERMSIMAWGRFPRMDAARALVMPFGEWFPQWLADQTLNRRLMLFVALFSWLLAAPGMLIKAASRRYWLGWLAFYLGTLFWLFTAPDFRFGYGFLIATILLALVPWLAPGLQRMPFSPARVYALVSLVVLAYLGFTLATSFEAGTFASRLLLPADYDRVPTQTCSLANGTVSCARAYNACSYDAFPCIPGPRPWVELRGPTLADGFRSLH